MIETLNKEFASDVSEGLSSEMKRLSSRWFYDEIGDKIFIDIMNMPEYYLTRSELEIFKESTGDLIRALEIDSERFELYELGAGDGTKTLHLLRAIQERDFTYRPIDISFHAIVNLKERIGLEIPSIEVQGIQDEYFSALQNMNTHSRKIILFMGSNIGNMADDKAHDFLTSLSDTMQSDDKLLLGVDLKKSSDIVLPAYNDAQGHTAAFNLNLLGRINRELGGTFDTSKFVHKPEYDEKTGYTKSYLESTVDQTVSIDALEETFHFKSGERIFMEISRKYDDFILSDLLENTGLKVSAKLTDSKGYFADYILTKG